VLTVGKLLALLDADKSGFDRGITAAEARMAGFQRDANGRLHDLHGRFVREGQESGEGFGRGVQRGARRTLPGMRAVGKLLGVALRGGLISSIAGLAGGASQLLVGLVPTVGVLGLLPALGVAGASALVSLKLALGGVGDALKAGLSGDTEKFAEALKGLSPAAAAFTKAIVGVKPALDALKKSVQESFFVGLADYVKPLTDTYLPVLRAQLGYVAGAMGDVAKWVAGMLASPSFAVMVTDTLHNTATALHNTVTILPGIIAGLAAVAQAGAKFLPGLTAGFNAAGAKFALTMQQAASSGAIDRFITGGLAAFGQLFGLLRDLGSIVVSLFTAMQRAGDATLGPIGALVHTLAQFFHSAAGAQLPVTLFGLLDKVGAALAGTLGELLPIVGGLATQLLTALGPIVTLIAGRLLPIVVDLARTIGAALTPIIDALAPALDSVLSALMPIVQLANAAIWRILTAAAPVIAEIATVLGEVLTRAVVALQPAFERLLPVIAQLAADEMPRLLPLIDQLGQLLIALIPAIGPLTDLLVSVLIPLLRSGASTWAIWAPILTGVAQALTVVAGVLAGVVGWLSDALHKTAAWAPVGAFFAAILGAVGHAFMVAGRAVGSAVSTMVGWYVALERGAFAHILAMIGYVRSIPGRILAALAGLGGLLVNAGRDLVAGLIHGVESMLGRLRDMLHRVTDLIPSWKGPLDRDRRLLVPTGQALMAGLMGGMSSQLPALRALLGDITTTIPTAAAAGAGQGAAGGQTVVQVLIGDRPVEEATLRVIKGNPRAVALANRSGTKQLAFA
jgi:phage-related protein